jgi:hypothetical protein
MEHVPRRGRDLFRMVCDIDAEGVVAKWSRSRYPSDGNTTSWLKIKNPDYSQGVGRHEFFEGHGPIRRGSWTARRLDPAALASARRGAGAAVRQ